MYLCNALVSSMINGIKVRNCVIFAIVLLGLFFLSYLRTFNYYVIKMTKMTKIWTPLSSLARNCLILVPPHPPCREHSKLTSPIPYKNSKSCDFIDSWPPVVISTNK